MDQNQDLDSETEEDQNFTKKFLAKIAVQRIKREEHLWDRAEGRWWQQCLPLLCVAAAMVLSLVPPLRPVLTIPFLVMPLILIQISLWTTGRRQDALLAILKARERSDCEGADRKEPSDE